MARRCPKCGYERPEPGEVVTMYAGKLFCDCDDENLNDKEYKITKKE